MWSARAQTIREKERENQRQGQTMQFIICAKKKDQATTTTAAVSAEADKQLNSIENYWNTQYIFETMTQCKNAVIFPGVCLNMSKN